MGNVFFSILRGFIVTIYIQKLTITVIKLTQMASKEYALANKKSYSIKPFLQAYEARRKGDNITLYLGQIYNLDRLEADGMKEAFEFNQCIFSDNFHFSTANILKIKKIEETESFCVHYMEKFDKTLQMHMLKNRSKKGRFSEKKCLRIMEDILKGLASILQLGYRPMAIRIDNVVKAISKNPEEEQQTWKIKNVVYQNMFKKGKNNFMAYEENYMPPQILSLRNLQNLNLQQDEQMLNAILVWSLGILLAKLMGIQHKLEGKKNLSKFRDRQFNVSDILYIKNQYSAKFLKLLGEMLHFDYKRRLPLSELFKSQLFSCKFYEKIEKAKGASKVKCQIGCNLFSNFNKLRLIE